MASLKELQKFIKEISETGLYKVEIKTEDFELKIQSQPEVKVSAQPPVIQAQPQPPVVENIKNDTSRKDKQEDEGLLTIKAPMVGTFYRRPAPDKPPFVEVGDTIKKGDVVCIIEAMKIFNEIESDFEGQVVKILVEDASPVEFDQPLILVKPS